MWQVSCYIYLGHRRRWRRKTKNCRYFVKVRFFSTLYNDGKFDTQWRGRKKAGASMQLRQPKEKSWKDRKYSPMTVRSLFSPWWSCIFCNRKNIYLSVLLCIHFINVSILRYSDLSWSSSMFGRYIEGPVFTAILCICIWHRLTIIILFHMDIKRNKLRTQTETVWQTFSEDTFWNEREEVRSGWRTFYSDGLHDCTIHEILWE